MKQFLGKIVFLCALFSLLGLNVMPAPVAPMQPGISYGGRAVAIAVNPANADDILVASETGGLFRSKTHGGLWTQVSESSTFEQMAVGHGRRSRSISHLARTPLQISAPTACMPRSPGIESGRLHTAARPTAMTRASAGRFCRSSLGIPMRWCFPSWLLLRVTSRCLPTQV